MLELGLIVKKLNLVPWRTSGWAPPMGGNSYYMSHCMHWTLYISNIKRCFAFKLKLCSSGCSGFTFCNEIIRSLWRRHVKYSFKMSETFPFMQLLSMDVLGQISDAGVHPKLCQRLCTTPANSYLSPRSYPWFHFLLTSMSNPLVYHIIFTSKLHPKSIFLSPLVPGATYHHLSPGLILI